jgi:hypothetical protein
MSAMKRLNAEWRASGWNLSGFRAEDRPIWRRLLPPERASPAEAKPAVEPELEHYPREKQRQNSLFG